MELREFVSKTLVDIRNGVMDANKEIAEQEGKTLGKDMASQFSIPAGGAKDKDIIFDVAVVVTQEGSTNGGGGIRVAVINLGGEVKNAERHEQTSHIKFTITPHQWIG